MNYINPALLLWCHVVLHDKSAIQMGLLHHQIIEITFVYQTVTGYRAGKPSRHRRNTLNQLSPFTSALKNADGDISTKGRLILPQAIVLDRLVT